MLFDSFDHAMQDESAARQSDSVEMERFCNLQRSKLECQQTYRGTDQNGSRQITD